MVKAILSRNGQMKVTIPKAIAEAMGLEHKDKLKFVFNGKTWEIQKVNDDKGEK